MAFDAMHDEGGRTGQDEQDGKHRGGFGFGTKWLSARVAGGQEQRFAAVGAEVLWFGLKWKAHKLSCRRRSSIPESQRQSHCQ